MPRHPLRSWAFVPVLLIGMVALAACDDDDTSPAGRMRAAYAPTQQVTVEPFYGDINIALQPSAVFAADAHRLVRVDRATGATTDLLVADTSYTLARLAADATHVYVATQRGGAGESIVRIPHGGGAPEPVFTRDATIFESLTARDGALYAIATTQVDASTWRRDLLKIAASGDATKLADLPLVALWSFAAAEDGLYFASGGASSAIQRVPYVGGEPQVVQESPLFPLHLIADRDGVYWTLAEDAVSPATLYYLPTGASQPQRVAALTTQGSFAVNDLGFYWADFAAQVLYAVSREDLDGPAFELIEAEAPPMRAYADDGALVYSSNDNGALRLHVLPRQ